MVERRIRSLFSEYPQVLYGFTEIGYSPYAGEYRSALVFAVPYGEQLTIHTYTEERFEKGIQTARSKLEQILARLESILREYGVNYWTPPVAQNDEVDLLVPFSFKFAAVNAGLGWIGKNDVVITKEYGPRVRLSAVLIDEQFPYGTKIVQSKCPEHCRKCVDVCPHKALHNVRWSIGSSRGEIIDYHLCNEKRSLFLAKHGRKNACGLCLAVCPFGKQSDCT